MDKKNVIHYLEMNKASELISREIIDPSFSIIKNIIKQYKLNRFLYDIVGEPFLWFDKLSWSQNQWQEYVEDINLHTWVAYSGGAVAGYFELQKQKDSVVEIKYFGLVQDFIGKGLGSGFLSFAIKEAWSLGASKVILNTCSKDHPMALKNYLSRGFKKIREEES